MLCNTNNLILTADYLTINKRQALEVCLIKDITAINLKCRQTLIIKTGLKLLFVMTQYYRENYIGCNCNSIQFGKILE